MKKIISITLFVCILAIVILPISASSNNNASSAATIITQESFALLFNTDHIDDVTYQYQFELLEEDSSRANVILQTMIIINNQTYLIETEGIINSYELNNSDILWEGSLDGSTIINNVTYTVIAGFALLDSTEECMISLTIQNDSTIVAISFGVNFIQGSVLDFFLENHSETDNTNNTNNNTILNTESYNLNPENTYSTYAFGEFGPGFSEITHPGGGAILDLGVNGEWVYQNSIISKHNNSSYNALKSSVYFDYSRNILMVTLTPFSIATNNYVRSLGHTLVMGRLKSFGVSLSLEDTPAANYAFIDQIYKPSETNNINDYFEGAKVTLLPLFEDILSDLSVPSGIISSAISTILDNAKGRIDTYDDALFAYINIKKAVFSNYNDLDNISPGLPFRFILSKSVPSTYVGNTPYTVKTYVKYSMLTQLYTNHYSFPLYHFFYIEKTNTHKGTITLQ